MDNNLTNAQKKLTLKIIRLRDSSINFNLDFEPEFRKDIDHSVQTFNGLKVCSEVELVQADDEANVLYQYKYLFANGLRVIPLEYDEELSSSEEDGADDDPDVTVIAEIKAVFEAVYESHEKLNKDEVNSFGNSNVGFNVYPFWREYVQSSFQRMDIDPISLPFLKIK